MLKNNCTLALTCIPCPHFTGDLPDMMVANVKLEDFEQFLVLGRMVSEKRLPWAEKPYNRCDFYFNGMELEDIKESVSFKTTAHAVQVYPDQIRFVGRIEGTDQTWGSEFVTLTYLAAQLGLPVQHH